MLFFPFSATVICSFNLMSIPSLPVLLYVHFLSLLTYSPVFYVLVVVAVLLLLVLWLFFYTPNMFFFSFHFTSIEILTSYLSFFFLTSPYYGSFPSLFVSLTQTNYFHTYHLFNSNKTFFMLTFTSRFSNTLHLTCPFFYTSNS